MLADDPDWTCIQHSGCHESVVFIAIVACYSTALRMLVCLDPVPQGRAALQGNPFDTATNKASQVGIGGIFSLGDGMTFTGMPSLMTWSNSFLISLQNIIEWLNVLSKQMQMSWFF